MSPASTSWTCPVCERLVPARVDVCYCGCKRPRQGSRPSREAANGGTSPAIKLGIAGAAVVLLGAGAWYSSSRQSQAPAGTARPAPARAQPQAPPPAAGTNARATRDEALAPATANDASDAAAPPLEETIERAMPGVVMIETASSRGSGFFASPDLVVTNAHVLAGATTASITVRGGSRIEGTAVFVSGPRDIAFLQIPRQSAMNVALPLGRSANARLGQGVVALGWAQSMTQSTVTRGVVTGLRRDGDRLLLQTDAVPNPGDSGGPLLDLRGNVIGITTAHDANRTSGFAVAIDQATPYFGAVPPNTGNARAEAPTTAPPPATAGSPLPAVPTETEARRTLGAQRYEAAVAQIETAASALDAGWANYKTSCRITAVPGGPSHEWFVLYDPQSALHRTATYCADALAEIEQRARTISASMTAAAEAARQSGVYAGELRTLRTKHHLDYAGWDR